MKIGGSALYSVSALLRWADGAVNRLERHVVAKSAAGAVAQAAMQIQREAFGRSQAEVVAISARLAREP